MGERGIHGKQDTGVVGCDKVILSAYIGEDRGRAVPSRTFWLKEWEEARGILQHIDLEDGSLEFEGFIVRIPPSLLADLTSLNTLIGRDISILRMDSPRTRGDVKLSRDNLSPTRLTWISHRACARDSV